MGIEWKVDGRRVAPGDLGRELMKSMKGELEANIRREVARHRCDVHGQQARVSFHERAGEYGFEISGCCDEFVREVRAALA
jgi:hypothetical protein